MSAGVLKTSIAEWLGVARAAPEPEYMRRSRESANAEREIWAERLRSGLVACDCKPGCSAIARR